MYDLRSGNSIGLIQSSIHPNLSIIYFCERFYISNKSNNIVCLTRSSKIGDLLPNPKNNLTTTLDTNNNDFSLTHSITCLCADVKHKRIFSGDTNNTLTVWYYNTTTDKLSIRQQLKSVVKSSSILCIVYCSNINCLVIGTNNGYVCVWHETDIVQHPAYKYNKFINVDGRAVHSPVVVSDDNVPITVTQLNMHQSKFNDLARNNVQNGSIRSCMCNGRVWKCVCAWKVDRGEILGLQYFERCNLLMACSSTGRVHLCYMCDPGNIPVMQMVKELKNGNGDCVSSVESFDEVKDDGVFDNMPIVIKDRLDKTFNEIQEIEKNQYGNGDEEEAND